MFSEHAGVFRPASDQELRDIVDWLLVDRERLKRETLRELHQRSAVFFDEYLKREEMLVEIACFKELLALQRRLSK